MSFVILHLKFCNSKRESVHSFWIFNITKLLWCWATPETTKDKYNIVIKVTADNWDPLWPKGNYEWCILLIQWLKHLHVSQSLSLLLLPITHLLLFCQTLKLEKHTLFFWFCFVFSFVLLRASSFFPFLTLFPSLLPSF